MLGEKRSERREKDRELLSVCQGILMAYFIVLTVIYPLYAPGGYTHIGEVKYRFFCRVSLVTMAVLAVAVVLSFIVRRDREWLVKTYRSMTVTDWCAYGYFVAVLLSYLCSAYKEDALWGVPGWHMGVVTQVIFVFIYFAFSRYYHCSTGWIGMWFTASAAVFLLGICNRYSVYPIVMEGSTETFISTLGNINWFSGYWSVAASAGMTLYWISDKMWVRILSAVYCIVAMLSGVTQGSSSAYLVFGVLAAALLALSLGNRRIYRFLELCMLFVLGCLLGRWMCALPFLRFNYSADGTDRIFRIAGKLTEGSTAWWILGTVAAVYVLLRLAGRSGYLHTGNPGDEGAYRRRGRMIAAVIVLGSLSVPVMGAAKDALYAGEAAAAAAAENGVYYTVFDEAWGNGRGTAYNCGISAYMKMDSVHKMLGIGPDCFADYVYDIPETADRLAEQFPGQRLTNAHNEWLTLLVNTGMLGFVCYGAMFAAVFVRCLRGASGQPVLYVCAMSILAYTVHNMVSFQQVLNTPFVFIMMGIGERLCRSMAGQNTAKGASYE